MMKIAPLMEDPFSKDQNYKSVNSDAQVILFKYNSCGRTMKLHSNVCVASVS